MRAFAHSLDVPHAMKLLAPIATAITLHRHIVTSLQDRTADSTHAIELSNGIFPPRSRHCFQSYKYMGLQYGTECFCGDSYFTAEMPAEPTDTCDMPCPGDPEVMCGGAWTNSVYIVGDPADKTQEEIDVRT